MIMSGKNSPKSQFHKTTALLIGIATLFISACQTTTPPDPPTLAERGEQLFLNEVFAGNGPIGLHGKRLGCDSINPFRSSHEDIEQEDPPQNSANFSQTCHKYREGNHSGIVVRIVMTNRVGLFS